jgi:hypothetical protein
VKRRDVLSAASIVLTVTACSRTTNCVEQGDDVFASLNAVTELSRRLGLETKESEDGFVVGAARAVSDIERVPVHVCLREGPGGVPQFRVVSLTGDVLHEWRDIPRQ